MENLFSLLVFGALFFLMMRFGCGAHMMHGGHHEHGEGDHDEHDHGTRPAGADRQAQVDPVCGMTVSADSGYAKMHAGTFYRFCSRTCLDRFDAEPEKFLSDQPALPGPEERLSA